MALNTTVRNFFPGSTLDVMVEVVANHGGLFRFEMCWRNELSTHETEDCFEPLPISGRKRTNETGNELDDDFDELYDFELEQGAGKGMFGLSLELPKERTCEHCVLRWHWTAANNWGTCADGTEAVGCGYQEVYRNCADVSVSRSGAGIGFGLSERRRRR